MTLQTFSRDGTLLDECEVDAESLGKKIGLALLIDNKDHDDYYEFTYEPQDDEPMVSAYVLEIDRRGPVGGESIIRNLKERLKDLEDRAERVLQDFESRLRAMRLERDTWKNIADDYLPTPVEDPWLNDSPHHEFTGYPAPKLDNITSLDPDGSAARACGKDITLKREGK